MKINFAKTEHIDLISEFENDNFMGEAYSKNQIEDILKDNYLLKNNDNIIVAEGSDDIELIGYIIFHISEDFTDIYKIFVRENDRKNGVGTSLFREVEKLSKRFHSKKIMVEVRSKNESAISFYMRLGFNKISERKNYYNEPQDDAYILEYKLE